MRRYSKLIGIMLFVSMLSTRTLTAQTVQFSRVPSAIDGEETQLSNSEAQRVERFLAHVFPTHAMRHLERVQDRPVVRRVTYTAVSQHGQKFIVAGFTGLWKESANVLGVYRMEKDGPNQVWRSSPWEATYYGLTFATARVGKKTLVFFEEGKPESNNFALASVFSFQDAEVGAIVHDLTPTLPRLQAFTTFPFKPLYGQSIALRMEGDAKPSIMLSASDAEYEILAMQPVRFTTTWKLNPNRVRFERMVPSSGTMTNMGSRM